MGTKIGVTASTILDASSYIFSNYNGLGRRTKECGMKSSEACFAAYTVYRLQTPSTQGYK